MIIFHKAIVLFFGSLLMSLSGYSQTEAYEDILAHRSGFAGTVTGGKGGEVIVITETGDDGYQQLRSAVNSDSPRWIRFSPGLSGSIMISGTMNIGSNTTIDGRGANITLEGKNLADAIFVWGDTNVIVHNIRIYRMGHADDEGQGFGLAKGADNIWLDHVTFELNGDESLSFGWDDQAYTYRVTASYCLWYNTVKCILAGGNSEEGENIKLTVHHSAFIGGPDVGVSRIPLLRNGKIHFYNNYVNEVGWQAAAIHEGGEAFLENNFYYTLSDDVMNCGTSSWDPEPGWICDSGNILEGGATRTGPDSCYDCNRVFEATDYYEYVLDPQGDDVISIPLSFAGRSDEPQWITASSPKSSKINLAVTGVGEVSAFPARESFYLNERLTLTGEEIELGQVFSHWSGDMSSTDNQLTVIMDTSKNIVANFVEVPVYNLSTTTVGEGRVSSSANGDYNEGAEVKITAFPTFGFDFLYWEGDLTGNMSPTTVTMDSSLHITAFFSGATGIHERGGGSPGKYALKSYPNPMTDFICISFILDQGALMKLSVLNTMGQEVAELERSYQNYGEYNLKWNGTDYSGKKLPHGVYFIKLILDNTDVVLSKLIMY